MRTLRIAAGLEARLELLGDRRGDVEVIRSLRLSLERDIRVLR